MMNASKRRKREREKRKRKDSLIENESEQHIR